MLKILFLPFLILSLPTGIALGRLAWRRSTIYLENRTLELEAKRLELQEKRDNFSRKLLEQ